MERFKNVIIGFGIAGKSLAINLAKKGEEVAIIESFGVADGGAGTLQSKFLLEQSCKAQSDGHQKALYYKKAIEKKDKESTILRYKDYRKISELDNIEIINGIASFLDKERIEVVDLNKKKRVIEGERFFICTGAQPIIPPIEGLRESKFVYTSKDIMHCKELPKILAIIGSGYIGLEYGAIYSEFGSKVIILDSLKEVLPKEERYTATSMLETFHAQGLEFYLGSEIIKVEDASRQASITYKDGNGKESVILADAILVATGRGPLVDLLCLENTDVKIGERGEILVDEYLKTSQSNIWALGDVNGGLQFTHVALDDARIVLDQLVGKGQRSTKDRKYIPYSVFIEPPLSRVGYSKEQAREEGLNVVSATLEGNDIPKARILEKTNGFMEIVVDKDTHLIKGATLFCKSSPELINMIYLAMKEDIPYTTLMNQMYTHPTMSESLNDLLALIDEQIEQ